MVQALLCTQDWLRAKEVPIVDVEENLKELEEIEKGSNNFMYLKFCYTKFIISLLSIINIFYIVFYLEVQRGESNDVDDEVVFVDSLV